MKPPFIDIKYSRFLSPYFDFFDKHAAKKVGKTWTPLEVKEVVVRAEKQKEAWSKWNDKILNGIEEAIGLTFFENYIPVYIIPNRKGAFSDPIVISSELEGDRFIDILTHELIHRIFPLNKEQINTQSIREQMYPEVEDFSTRLHIFVHAIHESIYRDVIKDESRLIEEKEKFKKIGSEKYIQTWEIVEKDGYENILSIFKEKIADSQK